MLCIVYNNRLKKIYEPSSIQQDIESWSNNKFMITGLTIKYIIIVSNAIIEVYTV